MKFKFLLKAVVLLVSSQAFANLNCNPADLRTKQINSLPGVGYWLQAFGDCRVTYTSVGGVNGKLYNVCTGQAEPFPNGIDPFPITSPADPKMSNELYVRPGMSFFNMSDNNQVIHVDRTNPGVYQSVGLLESTPNKTRVRIAVGWRAGNYKDYTIQRSSGTYTVTPEQSAPVSICKNVAGGKIDSEIPVLSRDGRLIAARDGSSRNTKIFRINEQNQNCDLVAEIPGMTGKVSFDFDNEHVMYVIADPVTNKGRLMRLSLRTGVLRTISSPDEDVMYMTSRANGDILYTRRIPNSYSNDKSDLVTIKSSDVDNNNNSNLYEVLGQMWAKACNKQIDLDYSYAVGQRMSSGTCNLVVNRGHYSELSSEQKGKVTLAQLQQACSSLGGASPAVSPTPSPRPTNINR